MGLNVYVQSFIQKASLLLSSRRKKEKFCPLRIHTVAIHIGVELFAVLLLFCLDVIKCFSRFGSGELENGGVVEGGGVFFCGEHILTEKGIGFFIRIGGIVCRGAIFIV